MFSGTRTAEGEVESAESASLQSALQTALGSHYVLERELGRGGMATVYLARDLRHRRPVAIKVLHPELSAALGAERFLREIALTASLQHPHILPLFDSGEAGGLLYYVMPYVEGETLRVRLARERQLAVGEAVRIATEVASALDYAHRHGVIHRDVKPENILLHEGSALVADFGIALAAEQAAGARLTQTGLSLGTPQYMAPEQAVADRAVDARVDVYALGTVLYEMLAGEPPFTAASAQGIIARLMTEEPAALARHRRSVPPHVDAAVRTALEKLPADRFESAGAFAAALAGSAEGPTRTPARAVPTARRATRPRLATAMLASGVLVAGAALGWALGRRPLATGAPTSAGGSVRFVVEPDSGTLGAGSWWYSAPAIAPDGRTIVYVASGPSGARLYARRVDEITARPLVGTETGDWPFFSPDGDWVGFFSRGAIRKVRVDGGTPVVIAELPPHANGFFGGSWAQDDTIRYTVFASGALYQVPATGGTPTPIAIADTSRRLMHPHPLPGGRALLVTVSADWKVGRIGVLDLATGRVRRFGPGAGARLVMGHIVYVGAGGALYRRPFDLSRLEPTGAAEEIASGLDVSFAAYSPFDVSPTGTLVYRIGGGGWRVTISDRMGRELQSLPGNFPWAPRFSPDGRRVAYGALPEGQESGDAWNAELWRNDVWIADVASGETRRLTNDGNDNNDPVWSRDGAWIAYSAGLLGSKDLFVQPIEGGGARRLASRPGNQFPSGWTADASAVLVTDTRPGVASDVWLYPRDGSAPRPLLTGRGHQGDARASPDGRWVAYTSSETGQSAVYVRSYSTPGRSTLVSPGGGVAPVWRRDGRELYYKQGNKLIAATLEPGATGEPPVVRERTALFSARFVNNSYDASPAGDRFVFLTGGTGSSRLVVALDALRAERQSERSGQ